MSKNLKFSSVDDALNYLADLTGKKVKVANEDDKAKELEDAKRNLSIGMNMLQEAHGQEDMAELLDVLRSVEKYALQVKHLKG